MSGDLETERQREIETSLYSTFKCEYKNEGSDKYRYQEYLPHIIETDVSFIFGMINVMARTGVGKTWIPYKMLEQDVNNEFKESRFIVPNGDSHLVKSHTTTYLNLLIDNDYTFTLYTLDNKDKRTRIGESSWYHWEDYESDSDYDSDGNYLLSQRAKKKTLKKINNHEGNFLFKIEITMEDGDIKKYPLYIESFCHNTKNAFKYCNARFTGQSALYFDEFHKIATQFGLVHAGCRYSHNKSKLDSYNSYVTKEDSHAFTLLNTLTDNNRVIALSATLDDIICNDLLPYYGTMNIANIIIRHTEENFPDIPIRYKTEKKLYEELLDNYEKNIKTFTYFASQKELKKTYNKLVNDLKVKGYSSVKKNLYKNISEDGLLDKEKIKNSKISFFINKATTGLDVSTLKRILIFRKLSDSGSSSRTNNGKITFISNLSQQIGGRLRGSGTISWLNPSQETNPKLITNLFLETEKIFALAVKDDNSHIMRQINQHTLEDSVSGKLIRTFIFKGIKDGYFEKKRTMRTMITNNSILKAFSYYFGDRCEEMNESMKDNSFDIQDYLNLEKQMIQLYKDIYEAHMGDLRIFDTTNRQINYRSTGGSKSRPNISEDERVKGIEFAQQSITTCGLTGKSIFLKPFGDDNSDEEYEFMHAKWKKNLNNEQRPLSKFAVPIYDCVEKGWNHVEKEEDPILIYNDETGIITCNYETLTMYARRNKSDLRSKEHIDAILKEYSRLQNVSE
jgi:hypothetical protein